MINIHLEKEDSECSISCTEERNGTEVTLCIVLCIVSKINFFLLI